jgi:hypothetical protein
VDVGFAVHGFEDNQRVALVSHSQRVLPSNSLDAALQCLVIVWRNVNLVPFGMYAVGVRRHQFQRFAFNVVASAKENLVYPNHFVPV